jgi:hypothetical protein
MAGWLIWFDEFGGRISENNSALSIVGKEKGGIAGAIPPLISKTDHG